MAPEYRRTGLSTLFLQSVLQEANNRMYTKVLLKVHEDNRAAYRLYKKIGFSEKQKLNNRYEMEYAELK
jgi:ribosomal protein S18 acetylase RimI-like enzyme